jgi:zinc transport system ATP-binding protein
VSSTGGEIVACRSLEIGYGGKSILPAIDLTVRQREFWAVIGRNGSGKTSLLRTVLGLIPAAHGSITRKPGLRLSYLPQRSSIDELYPLLAREVVEMGVERGFSFLGFTRKMEIGEITRALDAMGVGDLAERPFRQLSEGQKQRILFARVAASRADLAILDEPTSAMDMIAEREAFGLLDDLRRRQGMTIVIVSHYLGLARSFASHAVLVDRDARAVVVGTGDEVFANRIFRERYADSLPRESHA